MHGRVTMDIKLIQIDEPVKVSDGITKQDITVADSYSTTRFILWEDDDSKVV